MHDHAPVMLREALEGLHVMKNAQYIDATFGRGGHTRAILHQGGKVIAVDHDEEAVAYAREALAKDIATGDFTIEQANFTELDRVAAAHKGKIAGILFDFGVSSPQLDDASRGFSFQQEAELDMRMDKRLGVKAKDLVNALGRKELYALLTTYAQEFRARPIVDAILRARAIKPVETTRELAQIVESVIGKKEQGRIHPATRTFLALRLAVNDELGSIERALPTALDLLADQGRLVTISFHEGEDRLVKQAMRSWEERGVGVQETKRPLQPSEQEVRQNPRSRSAKLRVFIKTTMKKPETV